MTIKKFAITTMASAALLTMAAPALACDTKPAPKVVDHKVGICHATGSKTNPYVYIVVDEHAASAHAKHQGDRDIIGVTSAAKCPKPVAPHTTPTPAPKPSPVVTPTPTPAPGNGQVLSAASTEAAQPMPTNLPDTGAGLSALLGLPTLAVAGRAYLRSRKG